MKITEKTTLQELFDDPALEAVRGLLISGGSYYEQNAVLSLKELQDRTPTWSCADMVYGLNYLKEALASGGRVVPVYDDCPTDDARHAIRYIALPAENERPYAVLLLAGGAYGTVCTMVESLPVAAKLHEMGISCYCLNYRTADPASFDKGLFPKPLEDAAATVKKILTERQNTRYIVCGFSAGANLAALFAAHAKEYGLPLPEGVMLAYPLNSVLNVPQENMREYMLSGLFGQEHTEEAIRRYIPTEVMREDYPKTYLISCLDDNTIPRADTRQLIDALAQKQIPFFQEVQGRGGHGFGLGTGTDAEGWAERAVSWLEGNKGGQ